MQQCPQISIQAGPRLHFGLIDLSGATRRIDGGIGLSIRDPLIEVTIDPSRVIEIQAPPQLRAICVTAFRTVAALVEDLTARITVRSEILPHSGFGSGTQIALSVCKALVEFIKRDDISIEQLAIASGRGGTSGIGIHAFQRGGLIVDGGRAWPTQKREMGPSASFNFADIPPCIANLAFPDWGICVALPRGMQRLHGEKEQALFQQLTPLPTSEVDVISRVILMGILPCVASSDFEGFCESMEELRKVGMKKKQWDLLGGEANPCAYLLKQNGFRGISTSSWGPIIFGFAPSFDYASEMAQSFAADEKLEMVVITKANNHGYSIQLNTEL
jgi:beta-RFAP synthase